eukprot:s275_g4.t1
MVEKPTASQTLEGVKKCWESAPICTSVVINFWQRYLEKLACHSFLLQPDPSLGAGFNPGDKISYWDLSCGTWVNGFVKERVVDGQGDVAVAYHLDIKPSANPQYVRRRLNEETVATKAVDMIRRYVPLKADRALPGDLMRSMQRCYWSCIQQAPLVFRPVMTLPPQPMVINAPQNLPVFAFPQNQNRSGGQLPVFAFPGREPGQPGGPPPSSPSALPIFAPSGGLAGLGAVPGMALPQQQLTPRTPRTPRDEQTSPTAQVAPSSPSQPPQEPVQEVQDSEAEWMNLRKGITTSTEGFANEEEGGKEVLSPGDESIDFEEFSDIRNSDGSIADRSVLSTFSHIHDCPKKAKAVILIFFLGRQKSQEDISQARGQAHCRPPARGVRRVSVTPSPSPEPPPRFLNRPVESKRLSESPVRRSPERASKGKGKGEVDTWRAEFEEAWLLDRTAMRSKAFFSFLTMYPRSPSPQREKEPETEAPAQMTKEEQKRNDRFQENIKKAVKTEAKELKKIEKEKGKETKGTETQEKDEKKEKKDKKEKGKKDKKGGKEEAEETDEKHDKKSKKEKKEEAEKKEEDEEDRKQQQKEKKTKEKEKEKEKAKGKDKKDLFSLGASGDKRLLSEDDDSSSGETVMEEQVEWVEIRPSTAGDSKYAAGYNYDSEDEYVPDEDEGFGPMPATQQELLNNMSQSKGSYGGYLLPGEGDAMAEYVKSGMRIPRRGEVGITADQIENLEDLGYVMSGSRHRRMNAVRIRKDSRKVASSFQVLENQVYSAEEKRALAMYNFEEKANRESTLVGELRELLEKRQKAIASAVGDGQTLDQKFASIGEQKKSANQDVDVREFHGDLPDSRREREPRKERPGPLQASRSRGLRRKDL